MGDPQVSKKRSRWRKVIVILVVIVAMLGVARASLPWAVRDYVNRTISRSPLYTGTIGEVKIHLWRGAYSIHDIKISKTTGNIPVPFFVGKRVDFSIEWKALLHHKVVGHVLMDEPELNFVDAPTAGESQTGAGGVWLQVIKDLFPFKINSARIRNGSVHFRAYQTPKPMDVYLTSLQGNIENLSNIRDDLIPLPATVEAHATVMDQAKLDYKMTLDPFSYRPTFHMATRLIGLDVTRINDMALTYGKFDFKRGWFDLVIETDAKEGQVNDYMKPLFRDLKVFSLTQDIKEDNVLQFFWQSLVGAAAQLFKNQSRNQFGTLIPFTADAAGATTTDTMATIGNVLRNAFIRAYLPRLEVAPEAGTLQFEAPEFTDSLSAGGTDL